MRWIIEVTWTAPITDVLIDQRPVANGELIVCEADFDVAWTSAGSVMTADGLIDGAPSPTVTWPHGSPAPVTVRPVSSMDGPPAGS